MDPQKVDVRLFEFVVKVHNKHQPKNIVSYNEVVNSGVMNKLEKNVK